MRSKTLSRRTFLGGPAALGITAYAAKASGFSDFKASSFNNLDDITTTITGIETIPVSLPVRPFADGVDKTGAKAAPSKYYEGEPLPRRRKRNEEGHLLMDYVLVKIHTDTGIVGMGEAPTDRVETLETVKFTIDRYMTPKLIGLNPFDIERNNEIVRRLSRELEVPLIEGNSLSRPELLTDDCHFNEAGEREFARLVSDMIVSLANSSAAQETALAGGV